MSGSGYPVGEHLQYAEDTPHQSGDRGPVLLAVRQNSIGSLVDTDGDYSPLTVLNGGALAVSLIGGAAVNGAVAVSSMVNAAVTLLAGTAAVGSTTDGGPAWAARHGVTVVNGAITTHVPFTAALNTGIGIISDTPTTNAGFLVLTDLLISVSAAVTVTISEETSNYVITGPFHMSANSPVQFTPRFAASDLGPAWRTYTANKRLQVQTSANCTVTVDAGYYSTLTANS